MKRPPSAAKKIQRGYLSADQLFRQELGARFGYRLSEHPPGREIFVMSAGGGGRSSLISPPQACETLGCGDAGDNVARLLTQECLYCLFVFRFPPIIISSPHPPRGKPHV